MSSAAIRMKSRPDNSINSIRQHSGRILVNEKLVCIKLEQQKSTEHAVRKNTEPR